MVSAVKVFAEDAAKLAHVAAEQLKLAADWRLEAIVAPGSRYDAQTCYAKARAIAAPATCTAVMNTELST